MRCRYDLHDASLHSLIFIAEFVSRCKMVARDMLEIAEHWKFIIGQMEILINTVIQTSRRVFL